MTNLSTQLTQYGEHGDFYPAEQSIRDCMNHYCAVNLAQVMDAAHEALETYGNAAMYNSILAKLPAVLDLEINAA